MKYLNINYATVFLFVTISQSAIATKSACDFNQIKIPVLEKILKSTKSTEDLESKIYGVDDQGRSCSASILRVDVLADTWACTGVTSNITTHLYYVFLKIKNSNLYCKSEVNMNVDLKFYSENSMSSKNTAVYPQIFSYGEYNTLKVKKSNNLYTVQCREYVSQHNRDVKLNCNFKL